MIETGTLVEAYTGTKRNNTLQLVTGRVVKVQKRVMGGNLYTLDYTVRAEDGSKYKTSEARMTVIEEPETEETETVIEWKTQRGNTTTENIHVDGEWRGYVVLWGGRWQAHHRRDGDHKARMVRWSKDKDTAKAKLTAFIADVEK